MVYISLPSPTLSPPPPAFHQLTPPPNSLIPLLYYQTEREIVIVNYLPETSTTTLNAKARYKSRGALGTSGSFFNQPPWHTGLYIQKQLELQSIQSEWTASRFLKSSNNFLRLHHSGRICWGLYLLSPIKTVFNYGGKFEIRNDWLRHRVILPRHNFMSVSKYWM